MSKKIDAILKIQEFILNELPQLKNLPEGVTGLISQQIMKI